MIPAFKNHSVATRYEAEIGAAMLASHTPPPEPDDPKPEPDRKVQPIGAERQKRREEIARLKARGYTYAEMAARLGISVAFLGKELTAMRRAASVAPIGDQIVRKMRDGRERTAEDLWVALRRKNTVEDVRRACAVLVKEGTLHSEKVKLEGLQVSIYRPATVTA